MGDFFPDFRVNRRIESRPARAGRVRSRRGGDQARGPGPGPPRPQLDPVTVPRAAAPGVRGPQIALETFTRTPPFLGVHARSDALRPGRRPGHRSREGGSTCRARSRAHGQASRDTWRRLRGRCCRGCSRREPFPPPARTVASLDQLFLYVPRPGVGRVAEHEEPLSSRQAKTSTLSPPRSGLTVTASAPSTSKQAFAYASAVEEMSPRFASRMTGRPASWA